MNYVSKIRILNKTILLVSYIVKTCLFPCSVGTWPTNQKSVDTIYGSSSVTHLKWVSIKWLLSWGLLNRPNHRNVNMDCVRNLEKFLMSYIPDVLLLKILSMVSRNSWIKLGLIPAGITIWAHYLSSLEPVLMRPRSGVYPFLYPEYPKIFKCLMLLEIWKKFWDPLQLLCNYSFGNKGNSHYSFSSDTKICESLFQRYWCPAMWKNSKVCKFPS